ncbi:MAG: C4-dicarboxylate TRAP transporter substrate-binding protein [Lachnospiraceae bacterium]|nr:C4-dicarboxylate TRAP transporter substrate-binding protein [Lachnospiraceae bacterium]
MKKKALLAGVLTMAMMAVTACSGMPGMGNTQTAAPAKAEGGAAPAADTGKVYELKISTSQTEQALITRNYQKLADELNEKSGGRLKVTVFPAGQLGSDEDVLEQAIQGANVAVNTDASRMGQYVKDFSILMMGYFADNYDECYKVTQTDTFKGWTDTLSKDHGIKILSFTFYDGPRHFMTNKPINSPADLAGQRIRTIGQEVCTETIQAMGATPISMSWGEVYNGIQSKALEGCEAQNTSTYPSRIYEVTKYQSKTGHFQLMQGLVCGQSWFDSLPEDLQTLLVETSVEVGKNTAADVMKEADEAEKKMVEAGMTVVEPDLAPFKEAVDPVYEKLGYAELRAQLYKEIGKEN